MTSVTPIRVGMTEINLRKMYFAKLTSLVFSEWGRFGNRPPSMPYWRAKIVCLKGLVAERNVLKVFSANRLRDITLHLGGKN